MRILVLGGTRFIGSYVVSQLAQQGHELYVFHRGETNQNIPQSIHHIYGDRYKLGEYRKEFETIKPDVVLDMLPLTEEDALLVSKTFQGIAKRVVAISSADVYQTFGRLTGFESGQIVETPTSEDGPLRTKLYPFRAHFQQGNIMYDYDKILVEKAFISNSDLPATILRLPMVHGPFDRQYRPYQYLKRMIDKRPYILLDEKIANWQTCRGYVENVAHAIVLAITNEKATNRIYNVAENEAYTELQWVHYISEAYGKWSGEIIIVKEGLLQVDINPEQDLTLSSDKIRNELGFHEIVSIEKGLENTIDWELVNPLDNLNAADYDYELEDKIYQSIIK
ncbi:NAD-dependent epimerase/dehydratase family protein [Bacillus sp. HMF5848]|uniref:NAD-dependent epimerase/dehydratase family protein n=1 Tax=Bacillus sp. HMF5848 TaxID=2495421 RepID=UPI000F76ECA3|nr:NAD-dependent epimerase/dehydratase family protein [Bacillus sp. HMF5848]RSK26105.1 NAD-dependent epimerase/dehydratase family protein [Bacillus sp. HMF5848]